MKRYTVCTALNKRQPEIYNALNKNDVSKARQIALECLDDPKITDLTAKAQAREIFSHSNQNLFLSTLMTYMTCMKVS